MPNFFKKFPTINYTIDGYSKDAMNIVTAAILKRINIDKAYIYQFYDVPAGTSAESLANELYKDSTLCWTLYLANGMINPLLEWPMSDEVLEEYTERNYGSLNEILYFYDMVLGDTLDDVADANIRALIADNQPIPENIHPVTAFEYETNQNRSRCKIRIIAPQHINQFVDMFNKSIQGKL